MTETTELLQAVYLITHARLPLKALFPNEGQIPGIPANPRFIKDDKFNKLVQSIQDDPELLEAQPAIVFEIPAGYVVLAGNMRSQACKKLKYKDMPCAIAHPNTPIDKLKAYIMKTNISYGEHDYEMLANSWDANILTGWGLDIPDFALPKTPLEAHEDNFDTTPPTIPVTHVGDLYEINGHRLHCADSTDLDCIARLFGDERANLTFTSPPYWVGKDYEYQDNETQIDDFISKISQGISFATVEDGGRVVINTGTASINRIDRKRKVEILPLIDKWARELRVSGWLFRHMRIWAKRGQLPASVSPKTDVIDQHNEFIQTFQHNADNIVPDTERVCKYYSDTDDTFTQVITYWNPDGLQRGQERIKTPWAQQGLWDDIHGEKGVKGHGAAFPVELPSRNIQLYAKQGEIVYEPFNGTGTTMVAGEQLNVRVYAQEFDPKWCDVTVRRMVALYQATNKPYSIKRNGIDITSHEWLQA